MFKKAERIQQKLKILIDGASGSGKTYSALLLAKSLGQKIAVLDTENGSSSLYSDDNDFDICELSAPYTPERYIKVIKEAEKAGYDVLIIDSISHEWNGSGGCLDIQSEYGGKYTDWKKVTPRHNKFIEAILQSKMHIIATARAKSDYIAVETVKNNKQSYQVQKVGMKSEQREGLDFEFTIVFRLNENHLATSTKDRTRLFDGNDHIITAETGLNLIKWLSGAKVKIPRIEPKVVETIDELIDEKKISDFNIIKKGLTDEDVYKILKDTYCESGEVSDIKNKDWFKVIKEIKAFKEQKLIDKDQVSNFNKTQEDLLILDEEVYKILTENNFCDGKIVNIKDADFLRAKEVMRLFAKNRSETITENEIVQIAA